MVPSHGPPASPTTATGAGTLLYARLSDGVLVPFRLDGGTGALAVAGPPVAAGASAALVVDPRGRFLWAGDGSELRALRVADPFSGALTPSGSAAAVSSGSPRATMAVDPSGRYGYVAQGIGGPGDCLQRGRLRAYAIDALGTWSPLGAEAVTEPGPSGIAFARSGRTLYVAASGHHTQLYRP